MFFFKACWPWRPQPLITLKNHSMSHKNHVPISIFNELGKFASVVFLVKTELFLLMLQAFHYYTPGDFPHGKIWSVTVSQESRSRQTAAFPPLPRTQGAAAFINTDLKYWEEVCRWIKPDRGTQSTQPASEWPFNVFLPQLFSHRGLIWPVFVPCVASFFWFLQLKWTLAIKFSFV